MRSVTLGFLLVLSVALLVGAKRDAVLVNLDQEGGCVQCIDTCYGADYWHFTYESPTGTYSPPVHACQMEEHGCLGHGICGGGTRLALVEELETIEGALQEGTPEDLKEALRRAPSRVILNRSRMALQVTGCSGEIFAHYPLPENFFAALVT